MMEGNRRHPTVHIPPSPSWDEATAGIRQQLSDLAALRRFLNSGDTLYDSDGFRMYEFKVRRCPRGRSHDWTECPYAHSGEKARRRDPLRVQYSSAPCPDFRKGNCRGGEACEFAHGVFECWLHPERYRTQPCKDGTACRRRVCFFAHTPDQLRVIKGPNTSSLFSPTSTLAFPPASPPLGSPPVMRRNYYADDELVEPMGKMRIDHSAIDTTEEKEPDWVMDLLDQEN